MRAVTGHTSIVQIEHRSASNREFGVKVSRAGNNGGIFAPFPRDPIPKFAVLGSFKSKFL
jgi:hypothetical protein